MCRWGGPWMRWATCDGGVGAGRHRRRERGAGNAVGGAAWWRGSVPGAAARGAARAVAARVGRGAGCATAGPLRFSRCSATAGGAAGAILRRRCAARHRCRMQAHPADGDGRLPPQGRGGPKCAQAAAPRALRTDKVPHRRRVAAHVHAPDRAKLAVRATGALDGDHGAQVDSQWSPHAGTGRTDAARSWMRSRTTTSARNRYWQPHGSWGLDPESGIQSSAIRGLLLVHDGFVTMLDADDHLECLCRHPDPCTLVDRVTE